MAMTESLLIALFCISVVFGVLVSLFALIRIFSAIISHFVKEPAAEALETVQSVQEDDLSGGALMLKEVDEQTAALIMAIVSDESGIPLTDLCFKSIKLVQA
ncbi:MAG: OadG family transporter subunit [Sedimentibacter sp.]|uniref:OadG family protein n=1 Tax=Sedimentibacter sp. TaxID=1960295 RepID=UPI003158BF4B